jgi:predicted GNAT family acetyltransferase
MQIDHDASAHRFSTTLAEGEAYLAYEPLDGGVLDLQHTIVPAGAQGQGTGEALVRAALDYAHSSGSRIVPSCPFVRHLSTSIRSIRI